MATTSPLPEDHHRHGGARCYGINHTDHAERRLCDNCGEVVYKDHHDRLHDDADRFACWSAVHECAPAIVEWWANQQATAAVSGEPVKGGIVEVFKGRKVPIGTTGVVKWIGDNGWGTSVGIAVEGEDKLVFTAAANVRPVVSDEQRERAEAYAAQVAREHAASEAFAVARREFDVAMAAHEEERVRLLANYDDTTDYEAYVAHLETMPTPPVWDDFLTNTNTNTNTEEKK